MKDKYGFIKELLNNHKLNFAQKERIIVLTAEEIKKDLKKGEILEERIDRIELKLDIAPEEKNKKSKYSIDLNDFNSEDFDFDESELEKINWRPTVEIGKVKSEGNTPKYLNPKYTYQYLLQFNQNKILSSTCHEIESNYLSYILEICEMEEYDFQIHLNKIISELDQHDTKYKAPYSLKSRILGYITGKDYYGKPLEKGWSTDLINSFWASKEMLEWASKYKLPPNAINELREAKNIAEPCYLSVDIKSRYSNYVIQTFGDLVLHFKSLFHIKYDNSLQTLITKLNKTKGYSEKILLQNIGNEINPRIELLTDVDKLAQTYCILIDEIIKQQNGDDRPQVLLKFYESRNSIIFSIHHINNIFNKTIQGTISRGIGNSFGPLINNQINGLCNFYIRADFGDEGFAEINIWNGKKMDYIKEIPDYFKGGVEYILEFTR
jgi:hypothetical protein